MPPPAISDLAPAHGYALFSVSSGISREENRCYSFEPIFRRHRAAAIALAGGARASVPREAAPPGRALPRGRRHRFLRAHGRRAAFASSSASRSSSRTGRAPRPSSAPKRSRSRAPDGYTLLLGDTATFAVNPTLYKKLPYDPQKDFAPISLTGRFALLLVVNPAKLKADIGEGTDRGSEEGAGQDRLRLARAGQPAPPRDGDVQAAHRHAVHARPLQGRGAGDPGPAQRPDSADVPRPRRRRAADQGRQAEGARRGERQAHRRAAGSAHRRRIRRRRVSKPGRGRRSRCPPARRRTSSPG